MIDCNKAGEFMEQGHYDKLSWWSKRKLKLHLKVCDCCKKYEDDQTVISKVIKLAGIRYKEECLSSDEKKKMKERLANNNG